MNFLSILILIFSILLVNCALETQGIVGGYGAVQAKHKHHAAIIGKYNKSNTRNLICSAAIITDFFLLSAANCFISQGHGLRKLTFSVLVGSITLTASLPREREIFKIYTFGFQLRLLLNDIAVLELKEGLPLHGSDILASVKVPESYETFEEKEGVVAGYGCKTVADSEFYTTRIQQRLNDYRTTNLTQAFAIISKDDDCENAYRKLQRNIHLCGVMRPDLNFKKRGICKSDTGAPLVYREKVVGIATVNHRDCDDTQNGGIYTRTSFYKPHIDAVVARNPLAGTFVNLNPIHVM